MGRFKDRYFPLIEDWHGHRCAWLGTPLALGVCYARAVLLGFGVMSASCTVETVRFESSPIAFDASHTWGRAGGLGGLGLGIGLSSKAARPGFNYSPWDRTACLLWNRCVRCPQAGLISFEALWLIFVVVIRPHSDQARPPSLHKAVPRSLFARLDESDGHVAGRALVRHRR